MDLYFFVFDPIGRQTNIKIIWNIQTVNQKEADNYHYLLKPLTEELLQSRLIRVELFSLNNTGGVD